jgi:hypothetical protein
MYAGKVRAGFWTIATLSLAVAGCGATDDTGRVDASSDDTGRVDASTRDVAPAPCTDSVQCGDYDPCTRDTCNEATRLCEHEPDDRCRMLLARGAYTVSPPLSYACTFFTIDAVSQLSLVIGPSRMQVFGLPIPTELLGEAPRDGMFQVGALAGRGRSFRLRLEGVIESPQRFDGTLTVTCTDCVEGDNCPTRSMAFRATRP